MPQAPSPSLRARIETSIDAIACADWNALQGTHVPFLRHEFLSALEHTKCVGRASGWQPAVLTLRDAQGLAAAAPGYLKSHSYGEFVFDFSWAQAYARVGLAYYPKLVLAVPFTPASGPRLLLRPDVPREPAVRALSEAARDYCSAYGLSSAHALFIDEADRGALAGAGWLLRRDCQFHWQNAGYTSFEQYLESFTAEKRKKARRERRRVAEAGIRFETRLGPELTEGELDAVYALHRDTFLRHGHEPYLTRAFFSEIRRTLPDALMVKLAMHGRELVATAIFFHGPLAQPEALYGRYWGAQADYHSLHFETCYHQGIEFCIERGIQRFEPGTQGEHKVSRGFAPTITWSAHHIADRRFRAVVQEFLAREGDAIDAYAADIQTHVPFREARRAARDAQADSEGGG
ncbi:MAG TPA: GNAT family N-acetyltransferase [Steroidobacteraceae bacterium]